MECSTAIRFLGRKACPIPVVSLWYEDRAKSAPLRPFVEHGSCNLERSVDVIPVKTQSSEVRDEGKLLCLRDVGGTFRPRKSWETVMPKALEIVANVSTCGVRSPRSIIETNETLIPAFSASSS